MRTLAKILTLASLLTPLAPLPARAECPVPARFQNVAIVDEGDFRIRFAVDRYSYAPDDEIEFFYSIENRGDQLFEKIFGHRPAESMVILTPLCTDINNATCLANAPLLEPSVVWWDGMKVSIPPGGCHVYTRKTRFLEQPVWPMTARYHVLGGLLIRGDWGAGEWGSLILPDGGVHLQIRIGLPVPVVHGTWGKIKSLYSSNE